MHGLWLRYLESVRISPVSRFAMLYTCRTLCVATMVSSLEIVSLQVFLKTHIVCDAE